MKLENLTAEIRPRGKWESVDLGVALVQRNYKSIVIAWLFTVVPMMIVISGAAYLWYSNENLWFDDSTPWLLAWFYVIAPFVFTWWVKPIFERVPLYILSRSLFGEKVSISQLVQQWPRMIIKDIFTLLVFRRFSMNRSFVMPIHELEGLKGSQYSQRVALLQRNGGDGASGLTIACNLLSWVSMLTVYIGYKWLTMYGFDSEVFGSHMTYFFQAFTTEYIDSQSVFSLMFFLVNYMIVISLLAPFYSGAGFAIYINSRTISEGWDIELAFKRMSERLRDLRGGAKHTLLSLACIFSLSFGLAHHAEARDTNNESVEQIMESEDYDLRVVSEKVKIKDEIKDQPTATDNRSVNTNAAAVSSLGTVLLWLIVAAVIVGVVLLIVQNLHIFREGKSSSLKKADAPRVKSVLGMDVTPESLPDDVLTAARKAWSDGDKQFALSLLYRGSLEWLVNSARVPIVESDTERDCVEHAKSLGVANVESYFSRLTNLWVAQAYGKISPKDNDIDWLCGDWPFNAKNLTSEGSQQ